MLFNFKEETMEIAIAAAAIGRINNENAVDLLERLKAEMTGSELAYYRTLYVGLTFSKHGDPSAV